MNSHEHTSTDQADTNERGAILPGNCVNVLFLSNFCRAIRGEVFAIWERTMASAAAGTRQ